MSPSATLRSYLADSTFLPSEGTAEDAVDLALRQSSMSIYSGETSFSASQLTERVLRLRQESSSKSDSRHFLARPADREFFL